VASTAGTGKILSFKTQQDLNAITGEAEKDILNAMPPLATVRASNASFKPPYIPVALFVGGTSGVGQALAQAFACVTNGNAHIILCGRNRAAASDIIASFPRPTISSSTGPLHEFMECDASLMRNVQSTTSTLLTRLPKLNFLVLSPGIMSVKSRTETTEGIDRKMALHYYARWKFTKDLMPLLQKAKDMGEPASVMSILGAGYGGPINIDDLGLKSTYSVANAALVTVAYNDMMMKSFSEQNPGIGFTHMNPGPVKTSLLKNSDVPMKCIANRVLLPLANALTTSPEDAGEYMLHALLEGGKLGGMSRRDRQGNDIGDTKYFGSDEERRILWEHTTETTTAV